MTTEQAKKIIELFGPCSSVYECMEPEGLIKSVEEHNNLYSWLRTQFAVEEILMDRARCSSDKWWKETKDRVQRGIKEMGL